jgi:hypothetical protein
LRGGTSVQIMLAIFHTSLLVFLIVAILSGVSWNLNVALICFSFMAGDGEHFFMYF